MPHHIHLYEVMKASHLFKLLLTCLLSAVVCGAIFISGVRGIKPLIFVFVITGALSLFTGLVMLATGHLKDDVTNRK